MVSCQLVGHGPVAPRLRLMILAGWGLLGTPLTATPAAQSMPERMSESEPPQTPSARTGRIWVFQVMPAMPSMLLAMAPSIPATRVPCQELTEVCVTPAFLQAVWLRSALLTQSPGSEASVPGQLVLLAVKASDMKQ